MPIQLPMGHHPIWGRLSWRFLPIGYGFRGVPFPAAFSMLCREADFAVIILTGVTMHLCWLVCRANAYMGLLIEGRDTTHLHTRHNTRAQLPAPCPLHPNPQV